MRPLAKTKSLGSAKQQEMQRPLTPTGQWMRENRGGIIVVKDRRAVNK